MKLFLKPLLDITSPIMSVDNDTYLHVSESKVGGEFPVDVYRFDLTFKIALNNERKNPRDYEKVVITVRDKSIEESTVKSSLDNSSRLSSPGTKFNDMLRPKLPPKLSKKLFAGIDLLKLTNVVDPPLTERTVNLASYLEEAINNVYSYTQITQPATLPELRVARNLARLQTANPSILSKTNTSSPLKSEREETGGLDPNSLIERINSDLVDLTEPVTDKQTLTSESLLESPELKASVTANKNDFYYDMLRYYLDEIPDNTRTSYYQKRRVTSRLPDVDITVPVYVGKDFNEKHVFTVQFDLYRKGELEKEETIVKTVDLKAQLDASRALFTPPEVSVVSRGKTYFVSAKDRDEYRLISKYNFYIKDIDRLGGTTGYRLLASVPSIDGFAKHTVQSTSNLSIVRVVPVLKNDRESNVFTNVIVGTGHSAIGNLTVLIRQMKSSNVEIDVFNVPKGTTDIFLFRRNCTDSPNSTFEKLQHIHASTKTSKSSYTLLDKTINPGYTYEYYVLAKSPRTLSRFKILPTVDHVSNYVMYETLRESSRTSSSAISVLLTDYDAKIERQGSSFSFQIKTYVKEDENEKITKFLKETLGEVYDQYLNPANNVNNPLGDTKGVPQYSDLYVHQVVRTNLNTSEREVFGLTSDGLFEDKYETQIVNSIKPINRYHTYIYQVFTYCRNPIDLFKKFVARGIDSRGKEYFYYPFKWRNTSAERGKLYADDANGLPIISAYESFTDQSYGLTASYVLEGSANFTAVKSVIAERIEKNTVKVSWTLTGTSNFSNEYFYDSFVVMKVVNGVRSFVGRTFKPYIYHRLTPDDVGSLHYVIVPILSEMRLDAPAYSNETIVRPDGIIEKVKAPFNNLSVRNLEEDRSRKELTRVSAEKIVSAIQANLRTNKKD